MSDHDFWGCLGNGLVIVSPLDKATGNRLAFFLEVPSHLPLKIILGLHNSLKLVLLGFDRTQHL